MTERPQDPQPENPYPQGPAPGQPGSATGQPNYASAPQALTPEQERTWATLAHVIPLLAFIFSAGTLGFVASLVIYLVYKDRGPFVRAHAANSLNLQITVGIALLISIPLMLLIVGFLTYGAAALFLIVIHIIAASRANAGQWYQPPLTARFVR
jgi:uncharacterized Tic20 family protein